MAELRVIKRRGRATLRVIKRRVAELRVMTELRVKGVAELATVRVIKRRVVTFYILDKKKIIIKMAKFTLLQSLLSTMIGVLVTLSIEYVSGESNTRAQIFSSHIKTSRALLADIRHCNMYRDFILWSRACKRFF